ncbi:MAG TPA: chromosome segregation protein SMC [Anaerovoracaceae bacterium]|nr:chromosome segregation protein SMC [Anaerovoracaceae bacterium]
MYFKRIDMHGFKSFAEPVSIEFHEGITCIVGPNGSGKSNISDAVRWVLGEQSPKMLRGGKMEEVIFAGTASRKSRGMAEVTLVIDNGTGLLPIDYAEVAITRRMYRSGESEYFINNSQCRLRDIRELIMDTGIGVDGYSLIGQGKIADIVSNKPESRREIFEEAAGIVKYRTKKAESERKLEASNANLERVSDIIAEIEGRIDGLKEDSEKAAEYLVLRDKYKELEINITLKNIENIQLKNEYIKDDLSELTAQIDDVKEDKSTIDQEISENRKRNEELGKLGDETRDRLLLSVEKINALVNQNQLNREKLSTIEKDKERLTEEISVLAGKLEKEAENAQEQYAGKRRIDEELAGSEAALAEKIKKYTEITASLSAAAEEIDGQKNRIYELHSAVSSKNSEINSLLALQGTLDKRKNQILSEKETADVDRRELTVRHENALKEVAALKTRFVETEAESRALKQKYNEDVLREKKLAGEMEALKISISQVSTRKKMIEEMESSYEGYNNAVKFIMKSNLSGINGVVAELIEVPKGFETAIETALGPALQNVVCEDDRSAQTAIGALKENKAGRLTFLPIKSMRDSNLKYDQSLKLAEGFQGFGVQCVTFDPKYQRVMEYLLGRVIVVDNLDHAVKLSKSVQGGGLRFVTLEGEVINSGGAITGGTFRNNTANLLERKAEAKQLGEKLSILERTGVSGGAELEKLRTEISLAQERIRNMDQELREKELELLSRENAIGAMAQQISDLQHSDEKHRNELENIETEKKSSGAMIDEIKAGIQKEKEEIAGIEGMADAGLQKYEDQKNRLEAVNEEITKARIAVGTAESQKNHVDQLLTRIEEYKKELAGERDGKELAIKKLEEEKLNLENGGSILESEIQAREAEKEAIERYLSEIQEEKDTVSGYLAEITRKKDEMDGILSGYQSQKYELEIKQAKYETQLDSYKDKLWEEFEISYLQAIEFKKKEFNLAAAVKESRDIKNRIRELGEVNVGAIKEYESVRERYEFLTGQRSDILSAMNSLRQIIDDMDKTIKRSFKESFDKIVLNFENAFTELFGGGAAELRLEDENNPLECGIEIVAQPPGKKLQNINLMSGGEKTMTAIALMFAVLKAKPTPFCILDEVEAALDDANIDRFARYLTNFNEIQFTLVTHQKATMEYADILYGVTMPEQGISKVISLRLGDTFEL